MMSSSFLGCESFFSCVVRATATDAVAIARARITESSLCIFLAFVWEFLVSHWCLKCGGILPQEGRRDAGRQDEAMRRQGDEAKGQRRYEKIFFASPRFPRRVFASL